MSKVIRLTEADLTRIVRRVIEEQGMPKVNPMNAPKKPTPQPTNNPNMKPVNVTFKGKTANLYSDQPNTKFYRKITIIDEPKKDNGGEVTINFGSDQILKYNCTRPNLFTLTEPGSVKPLSYSVFNNTLTREFYNKFCQTNPRGVTVPKADYAAVGSQTGSDIA
jgi:hypothetical protein